MDYERIKAILPPNTFAGKPNKLRARADVGRIVADIVLQRVQLTVIAKRYKTTPEAVRRFKNKYCTEEVVQIVHIEAQRAVREGKDDEFNDLQKDTQKGIHSIIKEQKQLYQMVREIADAEPDRLGEVLQPLMQLLRDQARSYESLAKTYSQLKDKTTVVLSLNEHPEGAKLMEALYLVFNAHPEAFEMFKRMVTQKHLTLDV